MSFTGQNLKDWYRQIDVYINDQRPINIEEMRNLRDVIGMTIYATEQLVSRVHDRNMPSWIAQNIRSAIGS